MTLADRRQRRGGGHRGAAEPLLPAVDRGRELAVHLRAIHPGEALAQRVGDALDALLEARPEVGELGDERRQDQRDQPDEHEHGDQHGDDRGRRGAHPALLEPVAIGRSSVASSTATATGSTTAISFPSAQPASRTSRATPSADQAVEPA